MAKKASKKQRATKSPAELPPGQLNVRRVAIDKINPAPYNPRKDLRPGDPEYENIKRSLTEFGYVEGLVWNERTGNLVGGHQRLKILIGQGATEVDVSVVDLEPHREKALNIALNNISGSWDDANLLSLISELSAIEGLDATLTGFSEQEISDMLDTEAKLTQLETRRPPAMSWALIGIPTVRFGEIAETIAALAGLPDVICETAVNDAPAGPDLE